MLATSWQPRFDRALAATAFALITLLTPLASRADLPQYQSQTMLGLGGPQYTREDGYRSSTPGARFGNYITGTSERYQGSTPLGDSTWLFDGNQIRQIGLHGPLHTRNDGFQSADTHRVNPSGWVIGTAGRYAAGPTSLGTSAWLFDGSTTRELGLFSPAHTRSDGTQVHNFSNFGNSLGSAGHVIGMSSRFNGSQDLGLSAWRFDGISTVEIGLLSAEHLATNGRYRNTPHVVNKNGRVVGDAMRFDGDELNGWSAWLFDGTTTRQIGLTDARHTRSDGYRSSAPYWMNESGVVVGEAEAFVTGALAMTAWRYDGNTTEDIGLTGPEHTNTNGARLSRPIALNQAGQVTGWASRYEGNTGRGNSAWFFDGAQTIEIGPTETRYTSESGSTEIRGQSLTDTGYVVGTAIRYDGLTERGRVHWVYSPTTGTTTPLVFSERPDGFAETQGVSASADGIVTGLYRHFDGTIDLGLKPFLWSESDGMVPLDDLIDGGLAGNGWKDILSLRRTETGLLVIQGTRLDQAGEFTGVLSVPEPLTLAALPATALLLLRRRTRQVA